MSEDHREIGDEVLAQVEDLTLDPRLPLIISDADEVLLQFVRGLESYLDRKDLYLDLTSFALTGNIKHKATDQPLEAAAVSEVVRQFHDHGTDDVAPVAGAAEALNILSKKAQIIVLSNVPLHRAEARQQNLARHGMDYPVIANQGAKGAAVRHLARQVTAPKFFLDDIPRNLTSVANHAADVIRMHFVADPRLARLLEPAEDCHVRLDTWPGARAYIEARLNDAG